MSDPNKIPTDLEHHPFYDQEMLQFNDGNLVLGFRTPGDFLPLGDQEEGGHKYARHLRSPGSGNLAMIATASNRYYLGGGYGINKNRQQAYELPEGIIPITIGEPCDIPGVGLTTAIEFVLLRYKTLGGPSAPYEGAAQIDEPSPFVDAQAIIDSLNNSRELY